MRNINGDDMNISKEKFYTNNFAVIKSFLIIFLIIIFSTKLYSQTSKTVVDKFGQIRVEGNKILDKNGNPVILRGMSLFWSQLMGKYYNYDCIKWLRDDWNCTVVRAAMGIEEADGKMGYIENSEAEFEKVKNVINACIDLGIYVIVDWHDHNAHKHPELAIKFFKQIAELYGDKPNLIYEIYNEPMKVSWKDDVKPYAEAVIKSIREIDSDNLIIVGTTTWSQDVDIASDDPLDFDNIAYALHFYSASHKQELRDKAKKALDNGIAIFVSEFGTCEYTGNGYLDYEEVEKWINFMEENKLSWCNWSIADKKETSAALKVDNKPNGNWKESDLSESGLLIRNKIKSLNKTIFDSLKD